MKAVCCSAWALLFSLAGCQDHKPAPAPDMSDAGKALSRQELLDPVTCRGCHPGQYAEWAGSMHAYAAEDPVFRAMNRRGQEETQGELGTFCVNCHAPMAVREGLTSDGLNLDELPPEVLGVTCYFCHTVESVEGQHNNPLRLSVGKGFAGSFDDSPATSAHATRYSPHLDVTKQDSSALCGACHDVTLESPLVSTDVKLERTFAEWQETLFAKPASEGGLGCNGCHMPVATYRDQSAEGQAPKRRSRRHDFEGVDLALTDFPGKERQRLLVQQFLDASLLAELCVSARGHVEVTLENVGSGHHWPSGASHDREAWLALKAYSADGELQFETLDPEVEGPAAHKALLKDFAVKEDGTPAHMFWDVARIDKSTTIPGVSTRDPLDPEFHRERRRWVFDTEQTGLDSIERVTLTVRIRPIALEILNDLVNSGHLDEKFATLMPVLDVLPNRCVDSETRARFSQLFPESGDCDDNPDREFTLVWQREEAVPENRNFREWRVEGVPAKCLSHTTYVAVPASE